MNRNYQGILKLKWVVWNLGKSWNLYQQQKCNLPITIYFKAGMVFVLQIRVYWASHKYKPLIKCQDIAAIKLMSNTHNSIVPSCINETFNLRLKKDSSGKAFTKKPSMPDLLIVPKQQVLITCRLKCLAIYSDWNALASSVQRVLPAKSGCPTASPKNHSCLVVRTSKGLYYPLDIVEI